MCSRYNSTMAPRPLPPSVIPVIMLSYLAKGFWRCNRSVDIKIVRLSEWVYPNHRCSLKAKGFLWMVRKDRVLEMFTGWRGRKQRSCELPMGATWKAPKNNT